MSAGERLRLLVQIPNVLAEEQLRADPWGKGLSTDAFYDLILAATGSEKEARTRAKLRRAAMISEGVEPT